MSLHFTGGKATGLPIEVADEAERLAYTPASSEVRVKQMDTGDVYIKDGSWFLAPALTFATTEAMVAESEFFQSASFPSGSTGTLVVGYPRLVADEAALSSEVPTIAEVRAVLSSDASIWGFDGISWYPAPRLVTSMDPSNVLNTAFFQSQNYPNPTAGSLWIPSTIMPAQSFADHIQKFLVANVTISDSLCTLIDESLVGTYFTNFNGNVNLSISSPLTTANVDAILATMDTYFVGVTVLAGTINLTGLCGPVTLINRHEVSSCALFPTSFFVWESGTYGGYLQYTGINPTSGNSITFRYEGIYPRWDIYDDTAAATIGYGTIASPGDPPDAATYYDIMTTLQGGIVATVSVENLNKYRLEQRGLTVYTN